MSPHFLYILILIADSLTHWQPNLSTDQNEIYFKGKNVSLSRSLIKKLTLVQHFVNCDSLVFQTGADLLLKVHFLLCVQAY